MPKDHFIPAALLGRFSDDQTGPMRDRNLQVVSRHTERRRSRASTIGYKNGLYDVDKDFFPASGGRVIDNIWDIYEPHLPQALDSLIAGTLTASNWIRVVVPFVAAMFARDRFYAMRVEARLVRQGVEQPRTEFPWMFDKTHLNMNRVVEMNRFAARAIMCDWYVYEADGDLVIPDLGFGFDLLDPFEGRDVVGLMLPIGRRHVLELTPVPERVVARRAAEGDWQALISYAPSATTSADLNKYLAQCAQDFVAGTEAAVATVSPDDMATFGPASVDEVLNQWPFNVDTLILSGIHAPLDRLIHDEEVDLDAWQLDRFEGVKELDPGVDFQFARSVPLAAAACFLACTEAVISVRAHTTS